jgi:hypothetical protein
MQKQTHLFANYSPSQNSEVPEFLRILRGNAQRVSHRLSNKNKPIKLNKLNDFVAPSTADDK